MPNVGASAASALRTVGYGWSSVLAALAALGPLRDTRRAMSQENVEIIRRGYERWKATGEVRAHPDFVWDVSRLGWPDQQIYSEPRARTSSTPSGRMRGMTGNSRSRSTSTPGSESSPSSTSAGAPRPRTFPSTCASLRCGRSGRDERSGCRCTRTSTRPSRPWGSRSRRGRRLQHPSPKRPTSVQLRRTLLQAPRRSDVLNVARLATLLAVALTSPSPRWQRRLCGNLRHPAARHLGRSPRRGRQRPIRPRDHLRRRPQGALRRVRLLRLEPRAGDTQRLGGRLRLEPARAASPG